LGAVAVAAQSVLKSFMQIINYSENLLVKKHRGTMPIILTCPHGGSEPPPSVQEREKDKTPRGCNFTTSRDVETDTIAESVAEKILQLTGLSPYIVIAVFHRKFIDANRRLECAFTDSSAKAFYEEYHKSISEYVSEILQENDGRGFLFDIHGIREISEDPADIYLGTVNGETLQPSFQRADIFKRHGLHGLLQASRHLVGDEGANTVFQYRVSPADKEAEETAQVRGGFTVRKYAALMSNCIQLEIADTLRKDEEKRRFIIEDLAFAMINFVRRHSPF
jgi:N-formylglutamate amidohydrolase